MSTDKLRLLKQGLGNYITFKSFLSTTTNKSRALDFIPNNRNKDKNQVIVLYMIEMNEQNNSQQLVQPFANVTDGSCTEHEPEIIFSIGQIFKISSIVLNETTDIWTIHLKTLARNETEQLHNLTDYYQTKIVGIETFYNGIQSPGMFRPHTITTFVTIGNYYSSILVKNYVKAKFYYEKFLQEELESPDDFDFENRPLFNLVRIRYLYHYAHGYIYLQLANICYTQRKYLEAFHYNQKALQEYLKIQIDSERRMLLVPVHNNFAKIYWKYSEQYDQAIKYYLYALQINRNDVETFINIGFTQIDNKEYWHALHAFSTALSIIEALNETDYLSTGLIYHGMGRVYQESEKVWDAFEYYQKAEKIYNYSIPSKHELRRKIKDDKHGLFKVVDHAHDGL
jgi:tetratricopeptide (TPR) repeat protein